MGGEQGFDAYLGRNAARFCPGYWAGISARVEGPYLGGETAKAAEVVEILGAVHQLLL